MRSIQLLTLLAATAAALPAQWAQQSPTSSPSPRRAGAAAFDPVTNRMIIYGGLTASPAQSVADMWAYNGQWTQLTATGANQRWGHQMVADTTNGRLVTFGGRSPNISNLADDTLTWSGAGPWQTVATTNAPSPRFLYGLAYDALRDRVVLFGGRDGFAPNNETWEFDGTDWTQVTTANAPAPREEMGMAYDASLNRVVLFGGCDESTQTIYGDTWVYNGTNWTDVTPASSPSPRFRGTMVYDIDRSRTVYYGGFDGAARLEEVLEFAGGQWTTFTAQGNSPLNSTEGYSAYDSARGLTVLFGGFGPSFSDQTWEYTGTTDGVFALYGVGCDPVGGPPDLTGSTPNIGTDLTLTINNAGGTAGAFWALGFSDQFANGIPLPFDLGIIGLPGCDLLTGADILEVSTVTGGTTSVTVPIPNLPTLVGQSLFTQALLFEQGVLFVGTTQGGRALLGQ